MATRKRSRGSRAIHYTRPPAPRRPSIADLKATYRARGQTFVQGEGLLQHHFWGSYAASIAIVFATPAEAHDALATLGGSWKLGQRSGRAVVWHGAAADADATVKRLVDYGADPEKITSVKKSIDHGEPFHVVIPTRPSEQLRMFNPWKGFIP